MPDIKPCNIASNLRETNHHQMGAIILEMDEEDLLLPLKGLQILKIEWPVREEFL